MVLLRSPLAASNDCPAVRPNGPPVVILTGMVLPAEGCGRAEPVRDVRLDAGGPHAQGVTLPALPVVANRPGFPEVPAAAGCALRRLPTQRGEPARHDAGRKEM